MIPKLFDCLFQGSSDQRAADDNSTSLGLGLYIAREIMSAHKGTIEVQSSVDEGTSFIVHLPTSG
jgi:signal transduction histidine kinase